jgi:hypothetical protein
MFGTPEKTVIEEGRPERGRSRGPGCRRVVVVLPGGFERGSGK